MLGVRVSMPEGPAQSTNYIVEWTPLRLLLRDLLSEGGNLSTSHFTNIGGASGCAGKHRHSDGTHNADNVWTRHRGKQKRGPGDGTRRCGGISMRALSPRPSSFALAGPRPTERE